MNDYRVGFCLSNDSHNLWLISKRTYVGQSVYPENYSSYFTFEESGQYINYLGYYQADYEFPVVALEDFSYEVIEEDDSQYNLLHIRLDHVVFGSETVYPLRDRISFNNSLSEGCLSDIEWLTQEGKTYINLKINQSPSSLRTEIYINEALFNRLRVVDENGKITPFEEMITVIWDFTNYIDAPVNDSYSLSGSNDLSLTYLEMRFYESNVNEDTGTIFVDNLSLNYPTVNFLDGEVKETYSTTNTLGLSLGYYKSGEEPA